MRKNLLLTVLVLSTFSELYAEEVPHCPETELTDFAVRVTGSDMAKKLFREFFTEKKGHPVFDEAMFAGPYTGNSGVPDGSYSYRGWYGDGKNKTGGLLYPDGRLVQRGYCK